jgi:hypothetical protein
MSSTNATSDGRRADWRNRCRHTLCAIAISQFCGFSGRSPFSTKARYAFRKVVCVMSSASAGFRITASAYRYTSPTCRLYIRSKARSERGRCASRGVMP